jgi:PDZ domain-containing protein/aspartyl protease
MSCDPLLQIISVGRKIPLLIIVISLGLVPSKSFSVDLPLLYDGCSVRVAAEVGGKPADLIFDTGCTISALDRTRYQSELGEPIDEVRASSIGGLMNMQLYRCPEIVLGDVVQHFERIAAIDLSRVAAISGSECDGVLGADFAQSHIVSINFDRRLMKVEDAGEDETLPSNAIRLAMKPVGNGNFAVDATIDGVPISLMIDTGNNGSISLNAEDWDRVTRVNPNVNIHTILAAPISGAPLETAAFRLNELTIGPNHYRGFIATEVPNPHSLSTLGLRFLRQHIVRFDFRNRELLLRSGSKFGEEEVFDMSGLHLIRSKGVTLVYAVDRQSPADAAGIHAGDVVEKVNAVSAANLSMREIRRALKANDGSIVSIEIQRSGQMQDERLRLRRTL